MQRGVFVSLFLAAMAAPAAAAEIRVPQDEPTIQAAIDAAVADDVVIVSRGSYEENVVIFERTDLTIQAKGPVVIRSTGTGLTIDTSSRITVTGISVRGGAMGFDVNLSVDVTIEKFGVAGVSNEGVRVNDSNDIRLVSGRITNCGSDGIHFGEVAPVVNGEITDVKVARCGSDGIQVRGQNLVVSQCKVTIVEDDGFESVAGASPVRFEKCSVTRAESDGFLLSAPGTVAIDCTSKKCGDDAFDIEGASSRLERCQAKGARDRGFAIDAVDGVDLTSCKAIGNHGQGFELVDATNCEIELCLSKNSGEEGFSLVGISSGNTLAGNKASGSGTFDLSDSSEGPNTFTDNQFKSVATD